MRPISVHREPFTTFVVIPAVMGATRNLASAWNGIRIHLQSVCRRYGKCQTVVWSPNFSWPFLLPSWFEEGWQRFAVGVVADGVTAC